MFRKQGLLLAWSETKRYYIISLMLFFAGFFIGMTPDAPTEWLREQIAAVGNVAEELMSTDRPEWQLFWFILWNNVSKALMAMALGLLGGIFPILMLVMNGMVLGFLLGELSSAGANMWDVVVKSLLPHGVVELAAIFLACAFGIRFGFGLFRGIVGSLFGRETPWHSFKRTAIGAIPAAIVVVVLLLIAAIIESTLTFWLVT